MDLTKYKKRIKHNSLANAFTNDTISIVNMEFEKNVSYYRIRVNGEDEECHYRLTKDDNILNLWFRPQKVFQRGSYVEFKDKVYLVTKFVPNEIFPKAEIKLCNNILKWKDDSNYVVEYSCIIEGESLSLEDTTATSDKRILWISNAELVVLVQYNSDTSKIKMGDKFLFNGDAFDVIGIDRVSNVYNDEGILKLVVKSTSKSDSDENDSGVADDSSNSDWGGW